jgi:23S rRNA-/tRNA-specific pseudouridylate synthase
MPPEPQRVGGGLRIYFVDDAIIVLNKPSGLLSVPGRGADKQDCVSARVQAVYNDARVVHRLDMATSGLMVMARGATMQRLLNEAFATRQVTKHYEAVNPILNADLHCHSIVSDGTLTPEALANGPAPTASSCGP